MTENILFDEATHVYTVTSGDKTYTPPSVTTLLARFLEDYKDIPQAILQKAAAHGTKVHKALEAVQQGKTPDCSDIDYVALAVHYYKQMAKLHGIVPILQEHKVVYEDNGEPLFVGTLDALSVVDGALTLVDFKTTAELHETALRWQLTAYKMALEQNIEGLKIKALACIWLPKNGAPRLVPVQMLDEDTVLTTLKKYVAQTEETEGWMEDWDYA